MTSKVLLICNGWQRRRLVRGGWSLWRERLERMAARAQAKEGLAAVRAPRSSRNFNLITAGSAFAAPPGTSATLNTRGGEVCSGLPLRR
eukprot:3380298-Rhodomonas_salina.1